VIDHFPPEIGSAANLFYELGAELSKGGYWVDVLTTFPRKYNVSNEDSLKKYHGKISMSEEMDGMKVHRIRGFPIPKDNLFLRGAEHFLVSLTLFFRGLLLKKSDVIVVYSPPLPLAFSFLLLSKIKRSKIIGNIQDLYPQTIIDVGMLKTPLIIRFFRVLEKFVYKNSDFLTVHSPNNKKYLTEQGASEDKVDVIYNGVDTDLIKPMKKPFEFEGIDLRDNFVVSYAGVFAVHQGLDIILESAKLLERYKDIIFICAGDGFAKKNLIETVKKLELENSTFLPFQKKESYVKLLAASDVSLVCLSKEVTTPVVPGKLMSIMASGRPVIASIPMENDTVEIIKKADCGYCVKPGDVNSITNAILKIYENPNLIKKFGENGRKYAEKFLSVQTSAARYIEIFNHLHGR
jgi:glycosyltransferase involved in cell wall biosynthesis